MKVLVTGATGLVGRALLPALLERGHEVVALYRTEHSDLDRIAWRRIEELDDVDTTDFAGVDAVVHLAAHVHQMGRESTEQERRYLAVNCEQTLELAKRAAAADVRHFVFVSSIKAVGEHESTHPFRETDQEHPEDSYGRSKLQAERGLAAMASPVVTVLRFPLVYGPGVKANFAQLSRVVRRGWPLPLGCANARRSLLGVDNAANAILTALEARPAASRIYHVADRETPSVRELTELIANAFGRHSRLLNLPLPVLKAAATLLGRSDMLARLIEPLRLDTSRIEEELGWRAPVTLREGLARFAAAEQSSPVPSSFAEVGR